VEVGRNSVFTNLVPAETIKRSAAQQYAQMLRQAAAQKALAGNDNRQLRRLRAIAQRIIPQALGWNPRARDWNWEVNLIGSKQINAFCMPGGKIAFYSGILDQFKLTDDEVAIVMGP
jgi:Zn-dependent protease with chaperone function